MTQAAQTKDVILTTRVLRLRLKDKHASWLVGLGNQVNFVWNYLNELSARSIRERGKFLSAFDMHPYTKGAGEAGLDLHSQTLQGVARST